MDIIKHYSAFPAARTAAAGQTGTKTQDTQRLTPDVFQGLVKELNSLDDSAKLYNGSTTRATLSDTEIAVLANKYDLRNMSDEEYDAFLDDLESMGAISRYEKLHDLGYKDLGVFDMKMTGDVVDGVHVMSLWSAPLEPDGSAPFFWQHHAREANGNTNIFKWLTDRVKYEPSYQYKDPYQRKVQKDGEKLYEDLAGIASRMDARRSDSAEEARKAELVRQLADGNSSFYTTMRTMLKAQVEKSKEDQEEQAIIDALGAVLDALSGKKDVTGKKASVGKASTDLTKKLGERIAKLKKEDPENPEIARLENMLSQLQKMGLYFDLGDADDWRLDEDETFESLTQFLIRRQAESATHPNQEEVNEPA